MSTTGYTREELIQLGDALPTRGPVCDRCGLHIPELVDLNESDRSRVLALVRQFRPAMAMRELRAATGCSLRVAKLWVQHGGKPEPKVPGPPGHP